MENQRPVTARDAQDSPTSDDAVASEALAEALLDLVLGAAENELAEVLELVARTVIATTGFQTVVMNLFRPAFDDYEAVLLVGCQDGADTILGSAAPKDVIERMLAIGEEVLPAVYHIDDVDAPVWGELNFFVPDLPARDGPDAWHPEDALLVMLRDPDGGPLGFVSVDDPKSGQRPSRANLRLLRIVCSYAEQALRSAQRAAQADHDKRLLERLSEVSPRLSACRSRDELHALVALVVTGDLGFERVAVYTASDDRRLTLSQSRGWSPQDGLAAALDRAALERLIAADSGHSGCWLVQASELDGDARTGPRRSRRNGTGPAGWSDHALLVPWFGDEGVPAGVVVMEDPIDHLRPSEVRSRAARLLVDLAAAVARSIDQQERLVHQARYDELTGLRNRRGLPRLIRSGATVAVLLCDVDHFKRVNDQYGHDLGDRVLARLGDLLREVAAGEGVPIRLGGEEFCVVFPNGQAAEAVSTAERLRDLMPERTQDLVPGGVTVSVGVAESSAPVRDAGILLAAADRRLYDAKRAGRNRVVSEDSPTRHAG